MVFPVGMGLPTGVVLPIEVGTRLQCRDRRAPEPSALTPELAEDVDVDVDVLWVDDELLLQAARTAA